MVWVVWGLRNHGGNACLHACLQPAQAQIVASHSSTPHRQRQRREVPATHLDLEGPRVLGQHNLPSRVHRLHILHRVAAAQAGAGGRAEAACRWGGRGQQKGGRVSGAGALGRASKGGLLAARRLGDCHCHGQRAGGQQREAGQACWQQVASSQIAHQRQSTRSTS
jgi:hypothetical protein